MGVSAKVYSVSNAYFARRTDSHTVSALLPFSLIINMAIIMCLTDECERRSLEVAVKVKVVDALKLPEMFAQFVWT